MTALKQILRTKRRESIDLLNMRLAALSLSRSLVVQSRSFRGQGLVLPPPLLARRFIHNSTEWAS